MSSPRVCFPSLWKFYSQIPSVFKVKFPESSQSLCWIPKVGRSDAYPRTFVTVREILWYNCSPVCGSSAWWLYGGANGDVLHEGLCHIIHEPCLMQSEPLPPWQATADLCVSVSTGDTQSLKSKSGSVFQGSLLLSPGSCCAQRFVCAL